MSFANAIPSVFPAAQALLRKDVLQGGRISLFAAALLIAFLPFGNAELIFMALGAGGYLVVQALAGPHERFCKKKEKKESTAPHAALHVPSHSQRQQHRGGLKSTEAQRQINRGGTVKPYEALTKPVDSPPLPPQAPTFLATGWDAEVAELLQQIMPSPACEAAIAKVAFRTKCAIHLLYPDVQVTGFVSGNPTGAGGKACRVAVPDVEIVATVDPKQLSSRCPRQVKTAANDADANQVQKAVLRSCIDRLVNNLGMKFRRSAFRSREPKVTFLLPPIYGISDEAIPIDFSVNNLIPLHNATLMDHYEQQEPLTKLLALLVKRWAKDRGICHAAKGHLPPYAWTLLTIYYLQVGEDAELRLAPFDATTSSDRKKAYEGTKKTDTAAIARLFTGFLHFYANEFEWHCEGVSVSLGKREAPAQPLPLHKYVSEDGSTSCIGPSIQDPFDAACNLADGMTAASVARLHEELSRAASLCSGEDASLVTLLEPWKPVYLDDEEAK